MTSRVNDLQFGGDHYKTPIQVWDFILANDLGYLEGTTIKYLARWKKKGGLQDLYKARHFIDKLIEHEETKLKELEEKCCANTSSNLIRNTKEILAPDPNSNFHWREPVVLREHEI